MYLSLEAEAADCLYLERREENIFIVSAGSLIRLVAMLPCVYPATYGNSMHFIQNSGFYPSTYLVKEPLVGNYIRDYITIEPTVRDSAKEYHHADFHNGVCVDATIPTWNGEWQLPVPKISSEEQTSNVIVAKEVFVDDMIRNAYKAKSKGQNGTATALGSYVLHRTYLKSLKKKKLKSFMVRDLIDLPADERHSDDSDASLQCQNIQPRTGLSPPHEPEISWKNYELYPDYQRPKYTAVYEGAGVYSKDSLPTVKIEPSPSNPVCDSLQSSLDQLRDKTPTSSSDSSINFDPSARTTNSPDSLDSHSESCSGDSGVSPSMKSKRIRTIFSCSQLERLETEFERTHYMVGSERSQLAAELNLSESQVKVWFQNRRIKQRKQFHEQQQAMLSKLVKSQDDAQAEQDIRSNEDCAPSTTLCEDSTC